MGGEFQEIGRVPNRHRMRRLAYDARAVMPLLRLLSGLHEALPPVEHLHGKEGVDGSSPSEGSAKSQQIGRFAYVFSRRGGS
jgi:hypothetical protein